LTALQIATINTARHYQLRNFGAIAPRYWADFIVLDDLEEFRVRQTYKKGVLVAEEGRYLAPAPAAVPQPRSTMNLRWDAARDLSVRGSGTVKVRVIEIVPDQIVTLERIETLTARQGRIEPDLERDILKLVVVERHHATGNRGIGFVRGFNLRDGALGSTVAHDAHNIVVVGTNDEDIVKAIEELEEMQGGLVAVMRGKVEAKLPLPIAGLVSDRPLEEVIARTAELNAAARAAGCDLAAPLMALSFLSLSPIPALKLTDQGLIDAVRMRRTELVVENDA